MKPHLVVMAAIAAASVVAIAQPAKSLGEPWIKAGQNPEQYEIGIDADGYARGGNAKYLRQVDGDGKGWSTLMQQISPIDYRGKRVRFTAQVRTRDISQWSGLWMRADRPGQHAASFYNSADKPIRGTTGWQQRSVTLDVPVDANVLAFGVVGAGKGTVWIDELKLEVVGNDVPVDSMHAGPKLATKPSL
ncbi:transcriptional regulator [Massilia sp. METH4]|uniref:transcriptional regulator n=1 Tax=Massilia sp. METH4 TaxID=3123041 RepID=UPI0030D02323